MIAMELARELKVAGLPWRPHRGDLAMDRLNIPYIVTRDGTGPDGDVEIDTGRGLERKPELSLTWIPRLDQLLTFLSRHGRTDVQARPAGHGRKDVRWQLTIYPPSPDAGPSPRHFEASDGADAAGHALHYLLAVAGWRPGPPLAGESR